MLVSVLHIIIYFYDFRNDDIHFIWINDNFFKQCLLVYPGIPSCTVINYNSN